MKLTGKVMVVTGAGSGIGRGLTLALLGRGARVAAVDVNPNTLAETAALASDYASSISKHALSVADRGAVEALLPAVVEKFGRVDGVINNAGIIQPFVRLNDLDYPTIDRVFAVNWLGTLYVTKVFLPHLLKRPEAHIVNVSSMGGFLPVPGQTVYGASKAAVKLMTEGLFAELAETNVHVTVVFPGAVRTNITANSGVDVPGGPATEAQARRVLPADKAAQIILDGVEANEYRVLVGSDAKLMDRFYRLNPRRATTFIAKQMKGLLAERRRSPAKTGAQPEQAS